jgi:hypothetical protein
VRPFLVDLLFPVVVVTLIVGVLAAVRGQTWQDAAGYGVGLLAYHFLMVAVRAYRHQHARADGASDEDFDLLHYRPASKR